MSAIFNKNKEMIAGCFLVFLVLAALVGKIVLRECVPLAYGEQLVLWKPLPVTLSIILVDALLAAYFSQRGYEKTVGIAGFFLMIASTIVQMGGAVWLGFAENPMLATLYGYTLPMPFAFFLIATGCLKGAASAVVISMLSSMRQQDCTKVSGLFAALSVGVVVVGVLIIALRLDLEWIYVAIALFAYILMLLTSLLHLLRRDTLLWSDEAPVLDENDGGSGWRNTILCYFILLFSSVTFITFSRYVHICWLRYHLGHMPENIVASAFSLLVLAIGLFVVRNKSGKRNLPVWGSALLMIGLPLIPPTLDAFYVNLVPEAIVGIGLALVLGPALSPIVKVSTKYYAMVWVGTAVIVVILEKLFVIALNRMDAAIHSMSMAFYCIFPLLALILLLLGYLLSREGKGVGAATSIINH